MARSRRRKPLWPFLVVLGLVAVALGLGSVLAGPDRQGEAQTGRDPAGESVPDVAVPALGDRIRVEVLNGSGVPGAAGRATELLRDDGFDVVHFGNESSFGRDSSLVLDRTQKDGALESVSESLGIGARRSDPDASFLVDITVLLGTDWNPIETESEGPTGSVEGEQSEDTGWSRWDPRRFLGGGR